MASIEEKAKTVLLDADGILFDFVDAMLREWMILTGQCVSPDTITHYDITSNLVGTEGEKRALWASNKRPGFCREIHPILPAIAGVRRLERVHDVYVVTAPCKGSLTWCGERVWALSRYFAIPEERVLFTQRKHLVRGDVFVDDSEEHCRRWRESNPDALTVLWRTPRITTWDGPATSSWEELARLINT